MTAFAALILGIVQGATEFLPVSSSAHLAILHWITGWSHSPAADLAFDVALHFGTLIAILVYFGRDWLDFFKRRDRMVAYVLVGSIPGAAAGVALEEAAETVLRGPMNMAIMLAVMGLVMALAEWLGKRLRHLPEMGWMQALAIGLAQALAIIPGVSRAGITMSTGLFLGFTREAAARFSFLLATPILLGATLWQARKLFTGELQLDTLPLLIGLLASGLSGLACIHFLLRFLRQHTFYPFVIYRLALAAIVIVVFLNQGN